MVEAVMAGLPSALAPLAGRPASVVLTKPAAHCLQLFWPTASVYRVAGQAEQVTVLGAAAKKPRAQAVQVSAALAFLVS